MDVAHRRCARFLARVQAHHRAGDYYPDPSVVGAEAGSGREETGAVVAALRERGWLGRSPYDTERVRITPRGWERLRRESATIIVSSGWVRISVSTSIRIRPQDRCQLQRAHDPTTDY